MALALKEYEFNRWLTYMTVSPPSWECGIKCLIVRFVVSAGQILRSETNEVGVIKKSIVEKENSVGSLSTNRGEKKDCLF